MKRGFLLAFLVVVALVSFRVQAFQGPPRDPSAPKVVGVEKLKDNLYMLTDDVNGGNTAVFVGSTGVTVVDTKYPGWGQPIINKIKELTPKPITTIINTHQHSDHTAGNIEFPASVDIVVHANTAENMKRMAPNRPRPEPPAGPTIFEQAGGKGLPKRSFTDRMTFGSGSDRIELYYFGRGHTNGDAWVVFPALRTVHTGDMFTGKGLPVIDANNKGSGIEFGKTLTRAVETLKNIDTVIPGHRAVMTWADLGEYAEFMKEFARDTEAAMKSGKSIDEAAAAWKISDRYRSYTVQENRVKTVIQVIYDELNSKGP